MTQQTLALAEARRLVIAAQQFAPRGAALRTVRSFTDVVRRLGVLQIDSVNVLVRSHYLPLFSRRGAYPPTLLERAAYAERERTLFEYWGHEASLLPVETAPLFRWRMQDAREGVGTWKRLLRYASEHKSLVDAVRAQIRDRGPLGASELVGSGRSSGAWWGWSEGKEILEWLFWIGEVTTARRRNFERLYDLTERVLPSAVVAAPTPSRADAQRALLTIAARALGVATARDLRDYFRLPLADANARIGELVEQRILEPVNVEGWKQAAWLCTGAKLPRTVDAAALLSPFDSLIWERQRTERLFNFRFRLEIYTPIHKREHGYYVLPFLLGDRLVGRVDLKSDRKRSRLLVRGGSVETGEKPSDVMEPLRDQLDQLAQWLGLESVEITSRRGQLLQELRRQRRALRSRESPRKVRPKPFQPAPLDFTDQPNRQMTRNNTK